MNPEIFEKMIEALDLPCEFGIEHFKYHKEDRFNLNGLSRFRIICVKGSEFEVCHRDRGQNFYGTLEEAANDCISSIRTQESIVKDIFAVLPSRKALLDEALNLACGHLSSVQFETPVQTSNGTVEMKRVVPPSNCSQHWKASFIDQAMRNLLESRKADSGKKA